MEHVKLINEHGYEQDFLFDHAFRILRMPNQGGWKIGPNSKYDYIDGELVRRRNPEENTKPAPQGGPTKSTSKKAKTKRSLRDNNAGSGVQPRPQGHTKMD